MSTEADLPSDADVGPHDHEPHDSGAAAVLLNWLRAAVLGANDGIVSTAGLVMGVAGATTDRKAILIAGLAGLVAGALSMAAGEYVSVSTQRDTEQALLAKERRELEEEPAGEGAEPTGISVAQGLRRRASARAAPAATEPDAPARP